MSTLLAARFWPNVERRGCGECWPWAGPRIGTAGYGEFAIRPGEVDERWHTSAGAHRIAFYLVHGHWPENALHGCDFKLCCNAENLEHVHDGSLALNNLEMTQRGRRRAHGGRVPLTDKQKAEIVRRYLAGGVRQVDLAAEFEYTQVRISQVLREAGAARGKRRGQGGQFA